MKHRKKHNIYRLYTVLILIAIVVFWQVGVNAGLINPFFFSSPERILHDFGEILAQGFLKRNILITLQEAFVGLLYGSLLGTGTAILFGSMPKVQKVIMPIIVGINGLPKLALGPILIVWFGIGFASKIAIVVLMVYFIFLFNVLSGYNDVDVNLINAVRLLGGNRRQVLGMVIWPSCVPWLMASIRSGVGIAIGGAIVGEYLGSSRGLGHAIAEASGTYNMTRVLSCMLILVVIITAIDYLLRYLERVLLKWRPSNTDN